MIDTNEMVLPGPKLCFKRILESWQDARNDGLLLRIAASHLERVIV